MKQMDFDEINGKKSESRKKTVKKKEHRETIEENETNKERERNRNVKNILGTSADKKWEPTKIRLNEFPTIFIYIERY